MYVETWIPCCVKVYPNKGLPVKDSHRPQHHCCGFDYSLFYLSDFSNWVGMQNSEELQKKKLILHQDNFLF